MTLTYELMGMAAPEGKLLDGPARVLGILGPPNIHEGLLMSVSN